MSGLLLGVAEDFAFWQRLVQLGNPGLVKLGLGKVGIVFEIKPL